LNSYRLEPRHAFRQDCRSLRAGFLLLASPALAQAPDPENTLVMQLEGGPVTIRLRPDLAPQHAERLKTLARQGFYDNVVFHRVIPGFMAQTGDPTGTGMGGSELPDVPAEFSQTPFERGTVGMARSQDPNSANSQFFIMFDQGSFLNGQYTVVGEVVEGMELVDAIEKGEPPANPDKIVSMKVAADAK
jgi:peptidylprolyl isomerase